MADNMNAAERMEAKVEIRNLEKEGKYAEAVNLAKESATKCWKMCDNHNHEIFDRLARDIVNRMSLKYAQE